MKRKSSKDKVIGQQKHAIRRAEERYDFKNVTKNELQDLVRQIQYGDARFISKDSLRISYFECQLRGVFVNVAYDKNRNAIASFLPRILDETVEDENNDVGTSIG